MPLETKTIEVAIADLKTLAPEENARYMRDDQFQRLVANLREDGTLTSVPLVHRDETGDLIVLSGNHRVLAAKAAGIEKCTALLVVGKLDPGKRLALQLSHNAIAGQDDANLLATLYSRLPSLDLKEYSGLSDGDFSDLSLGVDPVSLGVSAPKLEEVSILFLPAEHKAFITALETLEKERKSTTTGKHISIAASYEDFDRIFNAVVSVKTHLKIVNSAAALSAMADLALERLAQLDPK